MNLDDYIHKYKRRKIDGKRLSVTSLAEKLNVSRCHLAGIIVGRYRCGKHLAYRIESVTNGEVTFEEILSNYKGNTSYEVVE